jgi:FkbM family methyltransferase
MVPADVYRSGARYAHTDGFTEHYSVCQEAKRRGLRVLCKTDVSVAHAFLDEYRSYEYDFGDGLVYTAYVVEDGSAHPHWNYFHEPETVDWIKRHVKKNWTCVDIGANVGHYTYLFAKLGNKVYSYEPNVPVHDMLRDSIYESGLGAKTEIKNVALSDSAGQVDRLFLSGMLGSTGGGYETTTLDQEFCTTPNLIKIDTDGYDFRVLTGAEQTINRCRPYLIIEADGASLSRVGDSVTDIARFLEKHGYTWAQHDRSLNWICVPEEREDESI